VIVSGCKAKRGEAGAGVGAITEGLPLTATTGAPEVGPADLQHDRTGAWLGDDGIGHRGSQNASGLKLLGDTMTSHIMLQACAMRRPDASAGMHPDGADRPDTAAMRQASGVPLNLFPHPRDS
jgi:hypothetical protein